MGIDPRLMWLGANAPRDPSLPPLVPPFGAGAVPASFGPMGAPAPDTPAPDMPDPAHTPGEIDTPAVPPHKSFYQRLLEGIYHVPTGAESAISPADANAMRGRAMMAAGASMMSGTDGFLPALIKGVSGSQGMFNDNITEAMKQSKMSEDLGYSQATRQADAEISAKYPERPDETPAEKLMRLTQMAADYAARGQPDRAKALAEVAKNIKASLSGAGEKGFQKVHDTAGNYGIFNPATGKFFFNQEEGWVTNHHDTGVDTMNAFRTRRLDQGDKLRVMNMNHYERSLYEKVLNGFVDDPQVKPVMTAHNGYLTLTQTLHDALSNPAATSVVTGQLAAFADPKARLQMQMMRYLENINPSLAGRFKRYVTEAANGKLPPEQVKDVVALVDDIESASEGGVRAARKRYIKSQGPALDSNLLEKSLPTVEDLFSKGNAGEPAKMVEPDAPEE